MARNPKSDLTWRHNGLFGSQRMMEMHLHNVRISQTTTPEAKRLAQQMEYMAEQLRKELTTKVFPNG